jgi:uncharacterized phage-associated protein
MPNAHDVAKVFLSLTDPDVGEIISNLKLQKLVYYAQGFHLAITGVRLFEDDIVAWEHGPVVESLYHTYKDFGASAIPLPEEFDMDALFSKVQIDLLREVYEVYGQFSAWKLRNMTHSEAPWADTPRKGVINLSLMQTFFSDYVS